MKTYTVHDFWSAFLVGTLQGKWLRRNESIIVSTETIFRPTKLIQEWPETRFLMRAKEKGYTHVEFVMNSHSGSGWMYEEIPDAK